MLIIADKYGQLGNRLFLFSHFIANAIEYNYRLFNPNFDEYCKYFEATAENNFGPYNISVRFSPIERLNNFQLELFTRFVGFLERNKISANAIEVINTRNKRNYLNLNNNDFLHDVKSKIVVVKGWQFRDPDNKRKYADKIRAFFTPVEPYKSNIRNLIDNCRRNCDVLIGIHKRGGDYKIWNNGKFYFTEEVFYDKMKQLVNIFKKNNQTVGFLICSNEKIDTSKFPGLQVYLANNHLVEDMYALAKCDYIIGPPSTYTQWASFYGKVPLTILEREDQNIKLRQFQTIGSTMYNVETN